MGSGIVWKLISKDILSRTLNRPLIKGVNIFNMSKIFLEQWLKDMVDGGLTCSSI